MKKQNFYRKAVISLIATLFLLGACRNHWIIELTDGMWDDKNPGISLTDAFRAPLTEHDFNSATVGYGAQTPLTVTVTNTGNQPTGALTVALSRDDAGAFTPFTLSVNTIPSIGVGGSAAFDVQPNTGLPVDTYTAAVTVSSAGGIKAGFTVEFTVTAEPVYAVTVTVNSSSMGSASTSPASAEAGELITLTATPATGHRFVDWTVTSGGVTPTSTGTFTATFTMPANAVAIRANFEAITYTLTVTGSPLAGGVPTAAKTSLTYNETTNINANTATGYTFSAWSSSNGGTFGSASSANTTFTMPASDVTVTAYYTQNTYTVTFNSNGGTTVSTITGVAHGTTISAPSPDPTHPVAAFDSWYENSDFSGSAWNFAADTVTKTITLYAKWTPNYAIGSSGPGGGVVFYFDPNGFTMTDDGTTAYYLEAWTADEGAYKFTPTGGTDIHISDGEYGQGPIGTGRKNTNATVAAYPGVTNPYAAKACYDATHGGKTDWFLPSIRELEQLYLQRNLPGLSGTFQTTGSSGLSVVVYMSSSDYSYENVHGWNFDGGDITQYAKGFYELYVRAIRAF